MAKIYIPIVLFLSNLFFIKIHMVYIPFEKQIHILFSALAQKENPYQKNGGMAMRAKVWMVMLVAMVVCVTLAMPAVAIRSRRPTTICWHHPDLDGTRRRLTPSVVSSTGPFKGHMPTSIRGTEPLSIAAMALERKAGCSL
jgi:hypothetical protein